MRAITLSFLGLAAVAFLACGGDDLVLPGEGEPASVLIVQGNGAEGRVGEPLADSLKLRVLDRAGRRVPNVTVVVELTGGSAEPDTVLTDELGEAGSMLTLGQEVGQMAGTVRVIDPESPEEVRAGFAIVALPAGANGLALFSGDGQEAAAGNALPNPLVVQVTDLFGNPIAGIPITWTAEGGGTVSETSTTTDAEGLSSVVRTLGTTAGPQTTTARSAGLAGSPVVFNHTATAGSPSGVQIISGNEQGGSPGEPLAQPLVVQVTDGSGNPVVGAAVTWVVTAGGGTLDPATGTTGADGRASTSWTLGPGIGANTAQAIVSGVGTATFTATASAGDPDDLRIVSGNEQTGQAGARLANDLVVEVVDEDENPVPGVTVTWRVESGGGTVAPRTATTGADGRAASAWTLGGRTGEQRVEASAPGAGTVRFEATATAGSPSTLGIVIAPPSNAQVGVPFSRQPVIEVRDASGNPVPAPGVTITAAVANGAGSLIGTRSQVTDANGRATFTDLGITGATGTHRLIFAAPGFTSRTSSQINVRAAETSTRIVSDAPDPSAPGQGVEVVFEVTSTGEPPTGTVRVTASGGGESCSAEVAAGRCTIVLTAEGTRTLTASFQGGSLFQPSSDTESHQVIAPDQPPTAQDDSYSATGGVTLTVPAPGVLGNDADPDGDSMTAAVLDPPDRGTFTLNSDGSFQYTPSVDFFGRDVFTYTVTAGGQSDTGQVEIIVN